MGGPADLHALLGRADYVSLHIPTSAETRGLMNAAAFRAMKPTASLINVGRGDLVDRAALIDALDPKTIAGAGLDVYWEEPPDPADPLLARENVVATPHVGGVTDEALARIATRVAEILKELVGEPPPSAVTSRTGRGLRQSRWPGLGRSSAPLRTSTSIAPAGESNSTVPSLPVRPPAPGKLKRIPFTRRTLTNAPSTGVSLPSVALTRRRPPGLSRRTTSAAPGETPVSVPNPLSAEPPASE